MKAFFQKYFIFLEPALSGLFILLGFLFQNINPSIAPYLFIVSFVVGGYKQTKKGFNELIREKKFSVEFLMIFAAIGATIIGYWHEGAMLIFIFSLSGSLEEYATDKSKKEIHKLMDLQPPTAKILDANDEVTTIAVEQLKIGDRVLVLTGEAVPIDGEIIDGRSSFNEAPITGESIPKEKEIGAEIFGGTINISQPIKMKVTKNIEETLLRRIVKMVDDAQNNPSKSEQFIERIEDRYVKVVLVAVFFMLFLPHFVFGWSWNETIYRAMVLLVVASPCALVASVTPATLSAISNGAKNGVLVKGGIYLENLYDVKAICFDKTGTLTYGTPQITDFYADAGQDKTMIMNALVSIEGFSTHPLAKAIVQDGMLNENFTEKGEVTNIDDVPGNGIKATFQKHNWTLGKQDFIDFETTTPDLKAAFNNVVRDGKTLVFIQKDDQVIGFVALQDVLRKDAKATINRLNEMNIQTILITGDNEHTAKVIADKLGIKKVYANCLPDEKVDRVKEIQKEFEMIAMVGDGINDAPALATANIGIAMGKGSDIAMESADVVLMESDISKLTYVITLSKRLHKISIQNIVFSLSVISVLIISNFFQIVSLPLGVVGHEGSTILVILNGLRLLYFKDKDRVKSDEVSQQKSVEIKH